MSHSNIGFRVGSAFQPTFQWVQYSGPDHAFGKLSASLDNFRNCLKRLHGAWIRTSQPSKQRDWVQPLPGHKFFFSFSLLPGVVHHQGGPTFFVYFVLQSFLLPACAHCLHCQDYRAITLQDYRSKTITLFPLPPLFCSATLQISVLFYCVVTVLCICISVGLRKHDHGGLPTKRFAVHQM